MTAVLLALAAAVAYGVSDFLSGNASRTVHYARVALITQAVMSLVTWAAVGLFDGVSTAGAIGWGLTAGLGSSFGTVFLYRGLGSGQMNVVAPLSAATAAVVPVVVGLALGERPSGWVLLGVALIIPAIWLISSSAPQPGQRGRVGAGAVDGLLAGVAFAVSFIALDQAPSDGGLWPAAYAQLSATVVIAIGAMLILRRSRHRDGPTPRRAVAAAAASGVLGAVAVSAFLLATGYGLLVVVSVLTALYPAITVLLARLLLGESAIAAQVLGFALAAGGVVLVAAG